MFYIDMYANSWRIYSVYCFIYPQSVSQLPNITML